MPSVEYTQSQRSDNRRGEIDLIDLIMQLWRAKLTIILFVVASLILSGIYLAVAKQKWSSEAIITLPDAGQMANYMNAMGVLYAQSLDNAPSVVEVQQRFFNRFNSLVSAFAEQLKNKDKPEKLTVEPVVKGQDMPLKITYVGNSAQNAQNTLEKYLQSTNQQVIKELKEDLTISIDSQLVDLKTSLATQEKVAREKQQLRLDVLNQALKVAEQSGVKKASVSQAETQSEDTLYLLGSDALSAMLKNESTRPLPLTDSYYATRQAFVAVSQLRTLPKFEYSYRYVMKPTLPIHRDSPKRGLTLILAILLGGIIGSGFVLGRSAIKEYQARNAA